MEPAALRQVAAATLAYIRAEAPVDPLTVQPGLFAELGHSQEALLAPLIALAEGLEPEALLAGAQALRWWRADDPQGRIRLTRYVVWQMEGALERSARFPHALYGTPTGEGWESVTRQQVFSGVYEPGGARAGQAPPLVWLSREGVHEALMQGTVEVLLPDGRRPRYNVAVPNRYPYRRGAPYEAQERLWYFREVEGVLGWGHRPEVKIPLQAGVAVAGDLYNLGLGRVILLQQGSERRLVVLADTGGAFQPNLGQLDLYFGAFPSRQAYAQASASLPERTAAWVLVS
jgi:membrane-bound lytic murein transglycosylase